MRDQREKWARVRIILLASLFACGFFAVSARVFYLQVLRHEQLVKLAERQHNRTVPLVPGRGGIYDRNGAPLAVSLDDGFTIRRAATDQGCGRYRNRPRADSG